jgi:hypothetical protein
MSAIFTDAIFLFRATGARICRGDRGTPVDEFASRDSNRVAEESID